MRDRASARWTDNIVEWAGAGIVQDGSSRSGTALDDDEIFQIEK